MFLMKNFSHAVNPLKSDLKLPQKPSAPKKKVLKIENYQNFRYHVMVGHVNVLTILETIPQAPYAERYLGGVVDLTMFNL